jgi:NAD(P)-dependent dehydrogenase (short-subunit alcohol dehydrogenase family)
MENKLRSKVAVITGGASGIGREICFLFGSEGAKIVVADVNSHALDELSTKLSELNISHDTQLVDVANENQVKNLMAVVKNIYGQLDILVNSAGILGPMSKPIDELSIQDWNQTLGINLVGMSLTMKYAIPLMKMSMGGTIINFASTAGLHPINGAAPYCVSKSGVIMLTRVAALEFGKFGIRVNAICPDKIDTPMMDLVVSHLEGSGLSKVRENISAGTVLNRFGTVREVASIALFLACEEDSSFVTGSSMLVDGGSTCT